MIKCIIIEDQEPAQRILKRYIEDTQDLELLSTFGNAIDAMDFLKSEQVQLIFLDIHLPKLSGLDFLSLLTTKTKVILTTAFSDYALKSYEYDVCDYLLKPFSFERFLKAVYKAKNQLGSAKSEEPEQTDESNTSVLIKVGYEFVKLPFDSILYIKSDGDYTQVFTDEQKYLVSHSLKYWQDLLPQKLFSQIHRSYIVHGKAIQKATASKVFIGNTELPIGRVYKKDFLPFYQAL